MNCEVHSILSHKLAHQPIMADLKICRICLRTEAKTYKLDRFQLQSYYEEVMALKMYLTDGLPRRVCYECASSLHNFHRFKEKCYTGLAALKEILRSGPISYEAVYNIDKEERKLQSALQIMTVTDRVKYYFTREENSTNDEEIPSDKVDGTECEQSDAEIDYVDEDSDVSQLDLILGKDLINANGKEYTSQNSSITQDAINNDECTKIMESKSVLVTDIKDESSVDMPVQDPVAIETNEIVMVPVIEFIDVKKEGVKQEELVCKKRKERQGTDQRSGTKTKRTLEPSQWKQWSLSEAEALAQFRRRSMAPRYRHAQHKCADCFRAFSTRDMLRRHHQLRHSESLGPFECRFCRVRFKYSSSLRAHTRSHYLRLECLRCAHVCSLQSTALLHEDSHSGPMKKCVHCGEEFRHQSTLYGHVRTVHRSAHVCVRCGVSCVNEQGLRRHVRLAHPDDDHDSSDEALTHCERCDLSFVSRRAYEEHFFHSLLHSEGVEDQVKDDTIPRKVLGKRKKAKILKEWSKKEIKQDDSLPVVDQPSEPKRRKKPKKLKRKPTTCYQCGEQFSTQLQCMKHHVATHPRTSFYPPAQRHICELCGASLAPSSVSAHQNMHSRQRMFACDTCGRAFHASVGLKRHLLTHTGAKPYACALCDKRFTQNNSMKLHYRTVHLKQPYPKRNRSRHAATAQTPMVEPTLPTLTQPAPTTAETQQEQSQPTHFLTLT